MLSLSRKKMLWISDCLHVPPASLPPKNGIWCKGRHSVSGRGAVAPRTSWARGGAGSLVIRAVFLACWLCLGSSPSGVTPWMWLVWPGAGSLADLWPSVAMVITHRPLRGPVSQRSLSALLEGEVAWESESGGPSLLPPCPVATLMWPGPRLVQVAWVCIFFFFTRNPCRETRPCLLLRLVSLFCAEAQRRKGDLCQTALPSRPPLPPPSRLERDRSLVHSALLYDSLLCRGVARIGFPAWVKVRC